MADSLFVKAYHSTPYSDAARRMADFLDISTGLAASLANWMWLFNIMYNRTARLKLPSSRLVLLEQHMAVYNIDATRIIDAMAHAGWLTIDDTSPLTITFTTWDDIEGRTFGSKAKT